MKDRKKYYKDYYDRNRERILDDAYFRRMGKKRSKRIGAPEIKTVRFFGIEVVDD